MSNMPDKLIDKPICKISKKICEKIVGDISKDAVDLIIELVRRV